MKEKSKRRILFISNGFYPKVRGAEKQMEFLARHFQKEGHQVEVLTLKYQKNLLARENYNGLIINRISYPFIKGLNLLVYLSKFTLYLILNSLKWDVYYIVIPEYFAFIASILGKLFKRTTILKFTGIGALGAGYISKLWMSSLLFWGIKKADYFIAVSNDMKEDLIKYGFDVNKIRLIPNTVNTELYKNISSEEKNYLKKELKFNSDFIGIFVGQLIKIKGVDFLIAAWIEFVKQAKANANLLIVGEGPEKENLISLAENTSNVASIKFLGQRSDVQKLMQISDLYFLPSFTEGLSNTLLESMSSGLACVCTDISGNRDLIEDGKTGLLLEAGNIEEIKSRILKIYNDKGLRRVLGENARKKIEATCSPPVIYNLYMEIL